VGYFGGTGEILGLGFGSFFLCLVVWLLFFFFWLYNFVSTWPFFFTKKLNGYLSISLHNTVARII
jgi:hypothetical protein